MSDNPSERYRRLARECLTVADTFPSGEQRDVLLQMAQVWQRLADDYADRTTLFPPIAGEISKRKVPPTGGSSAP